VEWAFYVEHGGLVWPDAGPTRPELKEALEDCVPSLSPVGVEPQLSLYWIDEALSALLSSRSGDLVIASGNAWRLTRSGDEVRVHLEYDDENEEHEMVPVAELVAGLTAYREAVVRAIEGGHELEGRWWAQKNPPS
jgi:hypothetical protein